MERQTKQEEAALKKSFPWLNEWKNADSFAAKQKIASRFASRDQQQNWESLALVAVNPNLFSQHRGALAHLASAAYHRIHGHMFLDTCLKHDDPRVVEGTLILLPYLRVLRSDGSDSAWPEDKVLLPPGIALRVSAVIDRHPALGPLVAKTLESFGPAASEAVDRLAPLLQSDRPETIAAAVAAIRTIVPDEVVKNLGLKDGVPMDAEQYKTVKGILADFSETHATRREFSEHYEALLAYCESRSAEAAVPKQDPEAEKAFVADLLPEEWWVVLSNAMVESDSYQYAYNYLIPFVASALYFEEGSPAVVQQLLDSDDSRTVAKMIHLIGLTRVHRETSSRYFDGDLIAPEVMPDLFVKALRKHPELCIDVAKGLKQYRLRARKQAPELVPCLLSDDPVVVWEVRHMLGRVDPQLVRQLDCELGENDYLSYLSGFTVPSVLEGKQRDLVEKYLNAPPSERLDVGLRPGGRSSPPALGELKRVQSPVISGSRAVRPDQLPGGQPGLPRERRIGPPRPSDMRPTQGDTSGD